MDLSTTLLPRTSLEPEPPEEQGYRWTAITARGLASPWAIQRRRRSGRTGCSLAEGLAGTEDQVSGLVASALRADLVQRASSREHWREQYIGTLGGDGTVLEGYVDLIFRDDDGTLVIVDYKTDAIPPGAIPSRLNYYRPQLEAYMTCLAAATGARVAAALLFLHPSADAVAAPL